MCGIIGAVGVEDAAAVLMDGLRKLEYRGYDSAGLAVLEPAGVIRVVKRRGKLDELAAALDNPPHGHTGIGHTRWATHGAPTERNAHPHSGCHARFALVHNGIIENHDRLHRELVARGHTFSSETDTEVLVHLLEEAVPEDASTGQALLDGVLAVLRQIEGAYSITVIGDRMPDSIVAARRYSPLVLGRNAKASYVASDIAALVGRTTQNWVLDDGQVALIEPDAIRVVDADGRPAAAQPLEVTWDAAAAVRGGYEHFVRKEIDEQPEAVTSALVGRVTESSVHFGELDALDIDNLRRVYLVAAGSSHYAALAAKQLIERWARLPTEVAIASEFRYGAPILGADTLTVLITQSGETADTLAALRLAVRENSPTLAVTNVVGSSVTRGADATVYLQVGPEIGVVATKSFTGQLVVLTALAADLARRRATIDADALAEIARALGGVPDALRRALEPDDAYRAAGRALSTAPSVYFIGRGLLYPIAMEAALKFKEITYIHAEGYAAGELKHGPIALLERGRPVVAFIGSGIARDKTLSNIAEVRARAARVLAVALEGDEEVARAADQVVYVPAVAEPIVPVMSVIPAQLLAYHAAVALDRDVDQPRNLAKSVTVE